MFTIIPKAEKLLMQFNVKCGAILGNRAVLKIKSSTKKLHKLHQNCTANCIISWQKTPLLTQKGLMMLLLYSIYIYTIYRPFIYIYRKTAL